VREEIKIFETSPVAEMSRISNFRVPEDNPLMGYLAIITAAFLWGLIGPVSRLALSQGLAPLEVAFFRALFAWILFGIHGFAKREIIFRPKEIAIFAPFGLVGVTLFYGAYQMAIGYSGAALAAVLLYTAPAWVVGLAPWILGENLNFRKALAVILALLGVFLVSGATRLGLHPLGFLFGLLSGFSYALYYLLGKRFLAAYPTTRIFFYSLPIGALGLLPFVEFHGKTVTAWIALSALAFFSTYGAYTAYFAGLRRLPASRAAILATLEPVVAAIVAHLWWKETFSALSAAGAALILVAATIGSLERAR